MSARLARSVASSQGKPDISEAQRRAPGEASSHPASGSATTRECPRLRHRGDGFGGVVLVYFALAATLHAI